MASNDVSVQCPECAVPLAQLFDAPPWCPACEWGLARFEPDRRYDGTGWTSVDRRLYDRLHRQAVDEFAAVAAGTAGRRGPWWVARAAGVTVYLVVLLWLAIGVWVGTRGFPSALIAPGLILVAAAAWAWPRAGQPADTTVLTRAEAPALHELVERVAAALGTPVPHTIRVDERFAAEGGVHGLPHRRYLLIGVPLWQSLSRQQRVALLGHHLTHFTNRDPRRSRLVGDPSVALTRLIDLLTPGPVQSLRVVQDLRILKAAPGAAVRGSVATTWWSEIIWKPIAAVLRAPLQVLRLALVVLPQRDVQRAEYAADAQAARAGGTAAALQLLDLLLIAPTVLMVLARDARLGEPASAWHRLAGNALVEGWAQIPLRRQLSVRRDVSFVTGRPPLGLRARMLEARAPVEPAVTLDEADNARVNAELAAHVERLRRALARGA
jgi:hypothetical protein